MCSTMEGMQYGGGRHIINKDTDAQYRSSIPSALRWRMCSTEKAHYKYGRESAVRICLTIGMVESVQYRGGTLQV